GMGVVFLARQRRPQRLVALKVILARSAAGDDRLARFRDEAEVIARLQHPHIVQLFEAGDYQGLPCFAMEYISGGSLAQQLAVAPLAPRAAAALVEALARAMDHAHAQGILHRDLKPANILLVAGGGWRVAGEEAASSATTLFPKITDFGLAKQ